MPFVPENRLEEALVRAVESPATAPEFYRLLLESDLLVLGTVEGQEDATSQFSLEPGGQLALVTGERNGERFLPVFSSLTRMQAYVKEESRYLSVNGRALLDLTRGAPVILNPGSDYGRELTPQQVEQLLSFSGPRVAAGVAEYPPALVEALTAVFEKDAGVQAAWMIGITDKSLGGQSHPLVGIETTGDMAALVGEIERAAREKVPGLVFDLQRVDRAQPTNMASALLSTQPFYQRAPSIPGRFLN
jgi:hypothetical protein